MGKIKGGTAHREPKSSEEFMSTFFGFIPSSEVQRGHL